MHNYTIQTVEISAELLSVLSDFTCGVPKMDSILHSQGLLSELHADMPKAYCVYNERRFLVAFCIVGVVNQGIEFNNAIECIDMIDITCLAVHKDYQCRGIGTAILNLICNKADTLVPGAEFVHVEALDLDDGTYSAVPFYQKYGFSYYSRAGEDAARMFYVLNKAE